MLRLESRAGEFTVCGKLKGAMPEGAGKPMSEQPQGKSLGLKGPGVTQVRLETR